MNKQNLFAFLLLLPVTIHSATPEENRGVQSARDAINNFDLQQSESDVNQMLGIQNNTATGNPSGIIEANVATNMPSTLKCQNGAIQRVAGLALRVDQCTRDAGNVIQSMNLSICDRLLFKETCTAGSYQPAGVLPAVGMVGMGNYSVVSYCTGAANEESCPIEVSVTMQASFNSGDSVALTQQAQTALANQSSTSIGAAITSLVNSPEYTTQLQDAASTTDCYNNQMDELSTEGDISNCSGTFSIAFGTPQSQQVCTNPTGGIAYQTKCTQQNGIGTLNCTTNRTCTNNLQMVNLECNKTLTPDCTGAIPNVNEINQYANTDISVYPYGDNLHEISNLFTIGPNNLGETEIWTGPCMVDGVISEGTECQPSKISYTGAFNQPLSASIAQANRCVNDGQPYRYICDTVPYNSSCDTAWTFGSPQCYYTRGFVRELYEIAINDLSNLVSFEVSYDSYLNYSNLWYYAPKIYINNTLAYPANSLFYCGTFSPSTCTIPPLSQNPARVLTSYLIQGVNTIRIEYFRLHYTQFTLSGKIASVLYDHPPYTGFKLRMACSLVTDNQCASVEAIQ